MTLLFRVVDRPSCQGDLFGFATNEISANETFRDTHLKVMKEVTANETFCKLHAKFHLLAMFHLLFCKFGFVGSHSQRHSY